MKKLVKIPFNHELIGQTGIVVKYRNGEELSQIVLVQKRLETLQEYPILSFNGKGSTAFHTLKGKYTADMPCSNDLIMYQEVEQKEPRIIWVNIYPNSDIYAHNSKEDAFNDLMPSGKIVKFIEVIEEGE